MALCVFCKWRENARAPRPWTVFSMANKTPLLCVSLPLAVPRTKRQGLRNFSPRKAIFEEFGGGPRALARQANGTTIPTCRGSSSIVVVVGRHKKKSSYPETAPHGPPNACRPDPPLLFVGMAKKGTYDTHAIQRPPTRHLVLTLSESRNQERSWLGHNCYEFMIH